MSEAGPSTNVMCSPDFSWANNAIGKSPCFVAAAVVGACSPSPSYGVSTLTPDSHYDDVPATGPANDCSCSWAAYNLYSACTACQGSNALPWSGYNVNCTGSLISNTTYYPSGVVTLDNTSIPFYATKNPMSWQNAVFNVNEAQNISEQRFPDVYGAPIPSSTLSKHKSNAGAIGGGVAGGVVVLFVGAAVIWWIIRKRGYTSRKRNGKPQEIDSTVYNQRHTRSYSDLSKSNIGDSNFGNSGYMSTVGIMQQPITPGFSPSPFVSASNMVSVSSIGAYSPPPTQPGFRVDSPPSAYHGGTSPPVSRYNSPSPSMQFMNGSQSPDSNRLNASFGNDVSVQPFLLPPPSPSPRPTKNRVPVDDTPMTREDSQDSLANDDHDNTSSALRRVNPPRYEDVAFSASQDVAAQRRESHGTGHVSRPPLGEKQLSQISQTSIGSQDSSIWTTPASNAHGGSDLAAIDAYVGQMASSRARPGGAGGADTVPVLHTTALAPGQAGSSISRPLTVNTTVDDSNTSVLDGRRGSDEAHGTLAIA